jgi:hypothetical protein
MQYILVNNGQVVWGPSPWNRNVFQSEIQQDLGIVAVLPQSKFDNEPITIGSSAKIMAAIERPRPSYHPLSETLTGPFWNFSSDVAEYWFEVSELPLEAAKPNYKAHVANARWNRERAGTNVTLSGTNVSVSTKREDRDQWAILYALGNDKAWKFSEGWIDLTKEDFKTIADAVHAHVQDAYDNERRLLALIDQATTHQDLQDVEQDPVLVEWNTTDVQL